MFNMFNNHMINHDLRNSEGSFNIISSSFHHLMISSTFGDHHESWSRGLFFRSFAAQRFAAGHSFDPRALHRCKGLHGWYSYGSKLGYKGSHIKSHHSWIWSWLEFQNGSPGLSHSQIPKWQMASNDKDPITRYHKPAGFRASGAILVCNTGSCAGPSYQSAIGISPMVLGCTGSVPYGFSKKTRLVYSCLVLVVLDDFSFHLGKT